MTEEALEGEIMEKNLPATAAQIIISGKELAAVALQMSRKTSLPSAISESLVEVSTTLKALEKLRKDTKEPILTQAKNIDLAFGYGLRPLTNAVNHLKGEYAAIQREEQERIRKEAEAEAKRIAKNAEKRAERVEAKGDSMEAENIRIQAEMEAEHAKAAITSQEVTTKAQGMSERKIWKIEVTDMAAFAAAVVSGKDKRLKADMLLPNMPVMNKLVKALEDGADGIPGTRVYYETSVAVRG